MKPLHHLGTIVGMNPQHANKYINKIMCLRNMMAEREGFEPSVDLRPQRFSRPPRSTTPAPLHGGDVTETGPMAPMPLCIA